MDLLSVFNADELHFFLSFLLFGLQLCDLLVKSFYFGFLFVEKRFDLLYVFGRKFFLFFGLSAARRRCFLLGLFLGWLLRLFSVGLLDILFFVFLRFWLLGVFLIPIEKSS